MSRFVICQDKQVWKFGSDADGTIDGLFQIPEITGAGVHHFCASANEGADWSAVDPVNSPFDGEVLILDESDLESLNKYIKLNSPKVTLINRLFGKKQKTSDLLSLLKSLVTHSNISGKSEFLSWV